MAIGIPLEEEVFMGTSSKVVVDFLCHVWLRVYLVFVLFFGDQYSLAHEEIELDNQIIKDKIAIPVSSNKNYPLVIKHSYWKWQFIVDFPMKKGNFPQLCWITRG